MLTSSSLPCKGRWQAEGLTEGYHAPDGATPLHRRFATDPSSGLNTPRVFKDRPGDDPTPNSLQGRILSRAEGGTPFLCVPAPLRESHSLLTRRREGAKGNATARHSSLRASAPSRDSLFAQRRSDAERMAR